MYSRDKVVIFDGMSVGYYWCINVDVVQLGHENCNFLVIGDFL